MRYEVRALRGDQFETMMVDAVDAAQAHAIALSRQVSPVEVRAMRARAGANRFDLSLFVQELIELLDAGLALVEAIEALSSREEGSEDGRQVVGQLLDRLRDGQSFSSALAQAEDVFPALFVGLVRAAEQTSGLQAALTRYLEYRGRFDTLRQKISAALIYPVILLSVGSLVGLFLLGFVVPRFAAVYRGGGRDLPLASRLLLEWGEFFSTHALVLTWLLPSLVAGVIFLLRRAWKNGQLELLLQRLPSIGKRVETFRIAQIYLAVGTLINGGMPIRQALGLAEGVAPPHLLVRLRQVGLALNRGVAASDALSSQSLVTPVALRLIRAGEGTGRLGEMLLRAARYHDNELARWIDRFSRIFEPVLMAAIGIVVGLIVVLLYMPIFDLAGSLQ